MANSLGVLRIMRVHVNMSIHNVTHNNVSPLLILRIKETTVHFLTRADELYTLETYAQLTLKSTITVRVII